MTTNNVSDVPPIQHGFNNLAEINQDPSHLPSTSTSQPPLPLNPTLPPTPISPPLSKPGIQPRARPPYRSASDEGMPAETVDIFDYMIWSRISVVSGAVILGIPAIILSIITRKYKRKGDAVMAKRLSRVTLGINVFATFVFMCGLVALITYYNGMQ